MNTFDILDSYCNIDNKKLKKIKSNKKSKIKLKKNLKNLKNKLINSDKDTNIDNSYLPLVEKYRPKNLDSLISHNEIKSTLKQFILKNSFPHLLFYGPPGTGKTSTIMACAKQMYNTYYPYMVLELNASDDRGIEIVRNRIKNFVISTNGFCQKNMFKLVILDETDAMTEDAQAILRQIVEKYTYNARFCLICNYIKKISPALQSRCTSFRFSPLDNIQIKEKLIQISEKENINITKDGINVIIKRAKGDMRKVLNMLQSTSMAYDIVNSNNVNNCNGYPQKKDMLTIINCIINLPFKDASNKIDNLMQEKGLSLSDIIEEILDVIIESIKSNKINNILNLNDKNLITILPILSTIEFNQSITTSEKIQTNALIGAFKKVLSKN